MERERERQYRGSEWSLCRRRESSAADGLRVWASSATAVGSLLCEGVGSFLFFVLSFSFLFFCSFLFWYCGSLFFPFLSFSFCSFRFWYSGSKMAFKCCWWGDRPEWYSSFMSSGTKCILKISDANVRCHGGQKKWGTRAH